MEVAAVAVAVAAAGEAAAMALSPPPLPPKRSRDIHIHLPPLRQPAAAARARRAAASQHSAELARRAQRERVRASVVAGIDATLGKTASVDDLSLALGNLSLNAAAIEAAIATGPGGATIAAIADAKTAAVLNARIADAVAYPWDA